MDKQSPATLIDETTTSAEGFTYKRIIDSLGKPDDNNERAHISAIRSLASYTTSQDQTILQRYLANSPKLVEITDMLERDVKRLTPSQQQGQQSGLKSGRVEAICELFVKILEVNEERKDANLVICREATTHLSFFLAVVKRATSTHVYGESASAWKRLCHCCLRLMHKVAESSSGTAGDLFTHFQQHVNVYGECCGMKGNSEREFAKDIHTAFVALCLAFLRYRTSLVPLTTDPTLLLKIVSQSGGITQDAPQIAFDVVSALYNFVLKSNFISTKRKITFFNSSSSAILKTIGSLVTHNKDDEAFANLLHQFVTELTRVYSESTNHVPIAMMFSKIDCYSPRYQKLLLEFLAISDEAARRFYFQQLIQSYKPYKKDASSMRVHNAIAMALKFFQLPATATLATDDDDELVEMRQEGQTDSENYTQGELVRLLPSSLLPYFIVHDVVAHCFHSPFAKVNKVILYSATLLVKLLLDRLIPWIGTQSNPRIVNSIPSVLPHIDHIKKRLEACAFATTDQPQPQTPFSSNPHSLLFGAMIRLVSAYVTLYPHTLHHFRRTCIHALLEQQPPTQEVALEFVGKHQLLAIERDLQSASTKQSATPLLEKLYQLYTISTSERVRNPIRTLLVDYLLSINICASQEEVVLWLYYLQHCSPKCSQLWLRLVLVFDNELATLVDGLKEKLGNLDDNAKSQISPMTLLFFLAGFSIGENALAEIVELRQFVLDRLSGEKKQTGKSSKRRADDSNEAEVEALMSAKKKPKKSDGVCKFFAQEGTCKKGIRCEFLHQRIQQPSLASLSVPTHAAESTQVRNSNAKIEIDVNFPVDSSIEISDASLFMKNILLSQIQSGLLHHSCLQFLSSCCGLDLDDLKKYFEAKIFRATAEVHEIDANSNLSKKTKNEFYHDWQEELELSNLEGRALDRNRIAASLSTELTLRLSSSNFVQFYEDVIASHSIQETATLNSILSSVPFFPLLLHCLALPQSGAISSQLDLWFSQFVEKERENTVLLRVCAQTLLHYLSREIASAETSRSDLPNHNREKKKGNRDEKKHKRSSDDMALESSGYSGDVTALVRRLLFLFCELLVKAPALSQSTSNSLVQLFLSHSVVLRCFLRTSLSDCLEVSDDDMVINEGTRSTFSDTEDYRLAFISYYVQQLLSTASEIEGGLKEFYLERIDQFISAQLHRLKSESINLELLARCGSLLRIPLIQLDEALKVKYLLLYIECYSQSPLAGKAEVTSLVEFALNALSGSQNTHLLPILKPVKSIEGFVKSELDMEVETVSQKCLDVLDSEGATDLYSPPLLTAKNIESIFHSASKSDYCELVFGNRLVCAFLLYHSLDRKNSEKRLFSTRAAYSRAVCHPADLKSVDASLLKNLFASLSDSVITRILRCLTQEFSAAKAFESLPPSSLIAFLMVCSLHQPEMLLTRLERELHKRLKDHKKREKEKRQQIRESRSTGNESVASSLSAAQSLVLLCPVPLLPLLFFVVSSSSFVSASFPYITLFCSTLAPQLFGWLISSDAAVAGDDNRRILRKYGTLLLQAIFQFKVLAPKSIESLFQLSTTYFSDLRKSKSVPTDSDLFRLQLQFVMHLIVGHPEHVKPATQIVLDLFELFAVLKASEKQRQLAEEDEMAFDHSELADESKSDLKSNGAKRLKTSVALSDVVRSVVVRVLKMKAVVASLRESHEAYFTSLLKSEMDADYFIFAAAYFESELLSPDTIRNAVVTHPHLLPLIVRKSSEGDDTSRAQLCLVSFLLTFFDRHYAQFPVSMLPFLMALYEATNSEIDQLLSTLFYVLSTKANLHIPKYTGYLWGKNGKAYLVQSKKNNVPMATMMENSIYHLQSLFLEEKLFDYNLLKKTHKHFISFLDHPFTPNVHDALEIAHENLNNSFAGEIDDVDTERNSRLAKRSAWERSVQRFAFGHAARNSQSSSSLARLYSLPFLMEIFLLSTQLFPLFRPRAFAHAFGCKFFLSGLAHRDAKFREISNSCMISYMKHITEGKLTYAEMLRFSYHSEYALYVKIRNSRKSENEPIPFVYSGLLTQCLDVLERGKTHILLEDVLTYANQVSYFDWSEIPFFHQYFTEEHLNYEKVAWLMGFLVNFPADVSTHLGAISKQYLPFLTSFATNAFAPFPVRQTIFTFLLHLAGFHPTTLLQAGILSWTNNALVQCIQVNTSNASVSSKIDQVPLLMTLLKFLSHLVLSLLIQTQQKESSEILANNVSLTPARKNNSIAKPQGIKILMKIPLVQLEVLQQTLFSILIIIKASASLNSNYEKIQSCIEDALDDISALLNF